MRVGRPREREKLTPSLSPFSPAKSDISFLKSINSSDHLRFASMGTVNSACVQCDDNHVTSSIGEPLKRHKSPSRAVRKSSSSDNFWISSTIDINKSAAQSGGSYSTISTANQTLEVSGSGNGNNPSEFVNHGLLLWNQSRQQWVGNEKSENRGAQLYEPRLSWSSTYQSLLTTNKRFTKPIPLAEMVDFLVDIWEQDGMYG
ncbi:AT-rich interactive domain-containing protein [Heracleum sosnowskyi]|uniref:AT-rich interactive domain-containing protein n=1 Tax=Heracleum sosnowskyi TaxID=360622 RepID=A0AAD8H5L8_9APIA|nr:AT-rich interactive domain-containing protein [Heracleum sosnowskyi]